MKLIILSVALTLSLIGLANNTEVTLKFNNESEAKEFLNWMSGSGEQDMGAWMEEHQPSLTKMPDYDFENYIIDFTDK